MSRRTLGRKSQRMRVKNVRGEVTRFRSPCPPACHPSPETSLQPDQPLQKKYTWEQELHRKFVHVRGGCVEGEGGRWG
jgi:hypothetical protein